MTQCKLGIGVVSKNIVDAAINFANREDVRMFFIPSRRQVEYSGGYVNYWTTKTFSEYVLSRTNNIHIKRDHGGPGQGLYDDDGMTSFTYDAQYFHAIHIDPWKKCKDIVDGARLTAEYIKYCFSKDRGVIFEIGTEQSIFEYNPSQLTYVIEYLADALSFNEFSNIKYAVIQSGTALKGNENIGSYNPDRLKQFIQVCRRYNFQSKEHNGDYLPIEVIHSKFSAGLDAINIAPEFGQLETKIYIDELDKLGKFEEFYQLCYKSGRWTKWVEPNFDPHKNKRELVNICGHYVFSDVNFLKLKDLMSIDIDLYVQHQLERKLYSIYEKRPPA